MAVDKRESRLELTAIDKASAVIGQVKGSVDQLRSSIDSVKNALEAVGVIVGAGAMGKLYLDVIKSDAALVDLSASTGASVESLSKLSAIAKVGGGDFQGLTDQMARMVRGLKSGNEEGQLASRALAFLGVSAKDANGVFRDTGELVIDVAKALSQYADDGNKVALVQDALGKGAQRFIPYLKDIVEYGNQAATTTAEQAKQAKEFELAVNQMNLALENNRRVLTVEYGPALTSFIEQMAEGTRIAGGFAQAMMLFGVRMAPGESIADIRKQLQDLESFRAQATPGQMFKYRVLDDPFGQDVDTQIAAVRKMYQFQQFLQRQDALAGRTGEENWDARDLRSRSPKPSSGYQSEDLHAGEIEMKQYVRAMQQLEEELGKIQDLSKAQIVINRVTTGSWKGLSDEHKAYLIAVAGQYDDKQLQLAQQKSFVDLVAAQAQVLDRSRQAVDDLRDANIREADSQAFDSSLIMLNSREREKAIALRRIDLELRQRMASLPRDTDGNLLPGASGAMGAMMAEAEAQKQIIAKGIDDRLRLERSWAAGTKGAFDEYASNATNAALQARMVFGNAFQNMEDALVVFARTGKLNFRNFADSLINDIIRIQTRMHVTGPLAEMTSGLFSGLGSSIGGALGFANGGVMSGAGSASLTRYANGGVATSPQLAMFGEGATPEAFVPLPDGRSIPVQMRGGMGGGGNTYIIDARNADSVAVAALAAELRQRDGTVEMRAVSAVQREAARRGKRLW
jgi:lambda family phage tail tape measure protein